MMSVGNILTLVTVGSMIAAVAFAGYQYKEVHLPAFESVKATVDYQACIQQCIETCNANGIPIDQCNCGHCQVYRNH
jgi:hypothetical protein